MSIDWFGVLDLGLGFGVVLALAVWELWRTRRALREDRARERDRDRDAARSAADDSPPPDR